MLADVRALLRFAAGLRGYIQNPIPIERCGDLLAGQLRNRNDSFLKVMQRAVYGRTGSPYEALLRWAGVEYGDLESMVRRDGVEAALAKLLDAGVYLTIDEFKGRSPVRRSGLEIPMTAMSCDNPLLVKHFETATGGTSGPGRRLVIDLDLLVHDAMTHGLFLQGAGLETAPYAPWRPIPPGSSGIKRCLQHIKLGLRPAAWFTQTPFQLTPQTYKNYLFTAVAVYGTRIYGRALPVPRHVPVDGVIEIVRWMSDTLRSGLTPHLDTNVSSAVRVCQAAEQAGIGLQGSFVRVGSEPFTPAKAAILKRAGCRVACHYAIAECGPVAIGCPHAEFSDEAHLLTDKVALVRRAGVAGVNAPPEVEPIFLTTLLPASPKLMLNVETGDYAVFRERECGCRYPAAGFRTMVHHIRSYEKLTTDGMHFSGSALFRMIDELLPARFGGAPTDYQFVEEEENGLPVLRLFVHPQVGEVHEEEAVSFVLDRLGEGSPADRMMADRWRDARLLRIVRQAPYATSLSKVMALHQPGRRKAT